MQFPNDNMQGGGRWWGYGADPPAGSRGRVPGREFGGGGAKRKLNTVAYLTVNFDCNFAQKSSQMHTKYLKNKYWESYSLPSYLFPLLADCS